MTGGRLHWHRVASHLKMPVRQLMELISWQEFEDWQDYLDWEEQRRTKIDQYLARLTFELVRSNAKYPGKVKLDDYYVRFLSNGSMEKMARSKAAWDIVLGKAPTPSDESEL